MPLMRSVIYCTFFSSLSNEVNEHCPDSVKHASKSLEDYSNDCTSTCLCCGGCQQCIKGLSVFCLIVCSEWPVSESAALDTLMGAGGHQVARAETAEYKILGLVRIPNASTHVCFFCFFLL